MRGRIKSRLRVRLQGRMMPFFPSARLFLCLGELTIAERPPPYWTPGKASSFWEPRGTGHRPLPSPWAHRPQRCPVGGLMPLQPSHLDRPQFNSQGYWVNHVMELDLPPRS